MNKELPMVLILIGTSKSLYGDELQRFNSYLEKYKDKIIVTNKLPYEGVISYLKACDILINPRQKSIEAEAGFPTKLGEYFSVKKPVISTNTGDIMHYFRDENCLLISQHDDPLSLVNKINYLYHNRGKGAELAENGYNWAKENLDYIKNAKKLVEFVGNL